MTAMTQLTDEEKWPSVDVAYGFVLPSYQLLVGRFEAADNRIASLMTLASSVMVAVPILARAVTPDISFRSPWFIAALVVFALIMVCGLVARIKGVLVLPNPGIIHATGLSKPEWKFKADALHISGQHFDANARAINAKGNWSIWLTALLALQIVWLVAWLAR
jgi:hypothetical protein